MRDQPACDLYPRLQPRQYREGPAPALEQTTGVLVYVSTASRARSTTLVSDSNEIRASYHELQEYFQAFVDSPFIGQTKSHLLCTNRAVLRGQSCGSCVVFFT